MKKTKSIFAPVLALLIITLVLAAFPTEAEAAIYEDTVRLHILANSDSEEDQRIKLCVRDGLLEKYGEVLSVYEDAAEAERRIEELLPEIENEANRILAELGSVHVAKAHFSDEWFDTRDYEEFTLPKGVYKSLIIEIGEAAGKNWWCVMFPPMCLEISSSNAYESYSDSEIRLIKGEKYGIRFKTLELLSELFTKNR